MTISRRDMLKQTVRLGAAAAGMGVATVVGQKLLQDGETTYPVRRKQYGNQADWSPSSDKHQAPRTRLAAESFRLIRPPGALEREDEFLAACIRCYRCQDACEPGAIQFFTERDGKHYHTPFVDPAIKACEPCMKCTQVCPTHALTPLTTEQRREINMASVELHEDLCLSYKAKRIRDEQAMMMELGREPTESEAPLERRGPCGECYMFCPVRNRAITLKPGAFLAPLIFPDECIGCGMCEEICRIMVRGEPAIRVVPIRDWT
ncbi:MAG: 4Fe-4S dicluster domain-containing protein [Planctomycetota bacterium]|jgi:ferredoxin